MNFQSILTTLRASTAAAHARLEARVRIEEQLVNTERYARLLEQFLGFYEPLERRLAALPSWAGWNVDMSRRIKAPWLKSDLSALGRTEAQIEALPRCERLPSVDDMAKGYGCAYVLEGSTLGGRHISGLMGTMIPMNARQFFNSYGNQVGMRWKEFVAALEEFAAEAENSCGEIVATAVETFSCMEQWLAEEGSRA